MRPDFSLSEAEHLALELYGIEARASALASYSDQNFCLSTDDGPAYVLKIANSDEPEAEISFQVEALLHLADTAPTLPAPRVMRGRSSEYLTTRFSSTQETTHVVWMVRFLEGQFMADVAGHSPAFLENIGRFLAKMDLKLASYSHSAMHRRLQWDLKHAGALHAYLPYIASGGRQKWIEHGLDRFEQRVAPNFSSLRSSVIHNDANDYNILTDGQRVTGIIDFGDMVHTFTVCEVAIAATYAMLGKSRPIEAARHVVAGYHEINPLTRPEFDVLLDLIYLRLCTSVCMSSVERQKEPDNEYLAVSEVPAWTLLEQLVEIDSVDWSPI